MLPSCPSRRVNKESISSSLRFVCHPHRTPDPAEQCPTTSLIVETSVRCTPGDRHLPAPTHSRASQRAQETRIHSLHAVSVSSIVYSRSEVSFGVCGPDEVPAAPAAAPCTFTCVHGKTRHIRVLISVYAPLLHHREAAVLQARARVPMSPAPLLLPLSAHHRRLLGYPAAAPSARAASNRGDARHDRERRARAQARQAIGRQHRKPPELPHPGPAIASSGACLSTQRSHAHAGAAACERGERSRARPTLSEKLMRRPLSRGEIERRPRGCRSCGHACV